MVSASRTFFKLSITAQWFELSKDFSSFNFILKWFQFKTIYDSLEHLSTFSALNFPRLIV